MDEAVRLPEYELQADQSPLADSTVEDARLAFVRFGWLSFNTHNGPDVEGLLFQYGSYSFAGPPVHMNLTR